MKFRLKMGIEGSVAAANLALVGVALTVLLISGYVQSDDWLAAGAVAQLAVAVLGFPVGWIALIGNTPGDPTMLFILAGIFLPLNAYVWGNLVAVVVNRLNAKKAL